MKTVLAFETRLRKCRNVITLGMKGNLTEYSYDEIRMIEDTNKIYYPGLIYETLLKTYGKKVFPSHVNYEFAQNKIKQTLMFQLCGFLHPKTKFFFGNKQKKKILEYFKYPFIAKIPIGSALGNGVFIIYNDFDLKKYLNYGHVAYIQEYLPIKKDIRIIVVGGNVIHAYWRIMKSDEFRSNVAFGGCIDVKSVPYEVHKLALEIAVKCGLNDIGLDICQYRGNLYLLEVNMKYGIEGFIAAGIDYFKIMEKLIEDGWI